jgi:hypothetical protein
MTRPRFAKLPKNVEELARWYMHYISPLGLIAGFLVDYFILLRRVDLWTTNLIFFAYLSIAAICILVLALIETGRLRHPWILTITPLLPVVAQFAFGGLFNGFLALYSKSAAVAASWIFIGALAVLLLANERFVRFYMRFPFQIGIFFTTLFSFLIFFLPVMFHRIGPYMFFASGITSVALITLLLYVLSKFVPEVVSRDRTTIARTIAAIFVAFNILYFTGAIPPLPLALKEAGVYHAVVRTEDEYRLLYEPLRWYESYLRYNTTFHRAPGESAYVFTAVFAPSGLSTTVFHQWQRYDEEESAWLIEETIPFFIVGGRDGGYRGYSVKTRPAPGLWRVNVITEFGQLIGKVSFEVVEVETPVPVQSVTH